MTTETPEVVPVDPTLRPMLTLLTDEQVERIVDQATGVLATTGVRIEGEEARTLLAGAGVRIEGDRAFPHADRIHAALETAPSEVRLTGRDGVGEIVVGGSRVCFVPGSTALHVLDRETRRQRRPTTRDLVHLARVTEALKHLPAQATAAVPGDVADALADSYRLYLALLHSKKPIVTGTFSADSFAVMKDMLVAVRGDAERLREQPLAVFDCCITSPLSWSELSCRALVDCARSGIPANLISVPMGGATAPVTVREMIVQHCAESLSGVLIHQLARPGAPVIYGGAPAGFDMRHGTPPMSAIEAMMTAVGYAQIGRRLGLPTHAYMGLADAKTADYQAGFESANGATLAALAGINLVAGAGMLSFVDCQSLEKLVLDDAACAVALRLAGGIGHGHADAAGELIAATVAEGQMLGHRHTRRNFRKELHIPGLVVDRLSYGDWQQAGARDAFTVAATEVDRILAGDPAAALAADKAGELDHLMAAEARRRGVELPPPG